MIVDEAERMQERERDGKRNKTGRNGERLSQREVGKREGDVRKEREREKSVISRRM